MFSKGAVAIAMLLMVTAPVVGDAKQTTKSLAVATVVQPYVKIAATQPAQLVITNKDVNLGYVDIPDAANPSGTQLSVQTNDRAGYTLLFQVSAANQQIFSSIQVMGLGATVVLPASGGKINMTYGGWSTSFKVTYRLMLAKKVKDGTYAWPFAMSAQPN
ncbi:hypothetical protein GWC77_26540 [Paraburkholderia sp. NMBU_R16]|nr:hypothetical protein [Paraburkholderia sp. NMBU_R16]